MMMNLVAAVVVRIRNCFWIYYFLYIETRLGFGQLEMVFGLLPFRTFLFPQLSQLTFKSHFLVVSKQKKRSWSCPMHMGNTDFEYLHSYINHWKITLHNIVLDNDNIVWTCSENACYHPLITWSKEQSSMKTQFLCPSVSECERIWWLLNWESNFVVPFAIVPFEDRDCDLGWIESRPSIFNEFLWRLRRNLASLMLLFVSFQCSRPPLLLNSFISSSILDLS